MENIVVNGLNITSLSDEELSERLRILGFPAGPIVDTTRSVYQRKLARMLKNEPYPISDSEEEIINSPSGNSLNSSGSFRYDELRRRPLPRVLGSWDTLHNTTIHSFNREGDVISRVLEQEKPPPQAKSVIPLTLKIVGVVVLLLFILLVYHNMEASEPDPIPPFSDS